MDIAKYAHFLARLAYEDDFRQRFIADPKRILTDMGIDFKESDVPDPSVLASSLAPKEILQKEYEDRFIRIAIKQNGPQHALLI